MSKNYTVTSTIASGSYGKVFKGENTQTGAAVAVKVSKNQLTDADRLQWRRERDCLKKLAGHKHILRLLDFIEVESSAVLITEYCPNGDLLRRVQSTGELSECEAQRLFVQLVEAVQYAHSRGIVHRDLKLENLFLDADDNLRVGDWGLATKWSKDSLLEESCGSLFYASPEICSGSSYRGPEVDVWSLGVCLYGLTTGLLPFGGSDARSIRRRIREGKYADKSYFSEQLRDLLANMLNTDPEARYSIDQVKRHPWLQAWYKANAPKLSTDCLVKSFSLGAFKTSSPARSGKTFLSLIERLCRGPVRAIRSTHAVK